MSLVKSFTVGDTTYNAAMPSAIEQDEILSLVGAQFIVHAGNVYKNGGTLSVKDVVLMLTTLPHVVKKRISEVLLSKTFVAGQERKVDVADFAGHMMSFNTLLAELFLWVYADFFDYVQNANKDA